MCIISKDIIMARKISKRKALYLENKSKKVGETCTCPICGDKFVKRQWQQAFDSRYCKDKFWNDKPDRHRGGYYRDYNEQHPERLERIGIEMGNIEDMFHPQDPYALGQE